MTDKDKVQDDLKDVDIDDNTDDYFEKVLKDDIEPPTDDDAGSDTSDKKVVDDPKEEPKDELTLEKAKARIAELEKEAKGRLSDVVKSRQEKAEAKRKSELFESELTQLKSAVSELLAKRNNALEDDDKEPSKENTTQKNIQFREDDSAFVDLSDVDKKIADETGKVRQELDQIRAKELQKEAAQAFKNAVEAVLAEDKEAFNPSFDYLQGAYKDLNDAVIAMQLRTGMVDEKDGGIDQDQALDMLAGSEEEKLFLEKHPGIDPTRIARAFNTKVDFRNSLRHISQTKSFGTKDPDKVDELLDDDKVKAAKAKPSGLGKTENQAGGTPDLIDRIASLGTDDILDFSDAEAEKIEAMLEKEALKGD